MRESAKKKLAEEFSCDAVHEKLMNVLQGTLM